MFVLGLQGSPRLKGNTALLLSSFLDEARRLGARTLRLDVARKKISPCQECGTCEKEGFCPIDDEMQDVFFLLREADIVVMATPVFFYGATAQLKALIDRTQTLWARKYVYKLVDPGGNWRLGLLLSVGATRGQNLFDGIALTAKYFFDAIGASFAESLTYRQVEEAGEIEKHPTALIEVKNAARDRVTPFLDRKRLLFVCKDNASLSQMASAFTRHHAGNRIEAQSGGPSPAGEVDPLMAEVMSEKGIDMAYRRPGSIDDAIANGKPDFVVSLGLDGELDSLHGIPRTDWDFPDTAGGAITVMRKIRDDIEERVKRLASEEGGLH
jgi:arsenate reductase